MGGEDDGAPTTVRGAVRRLHHEHARRTRTTWFPGNALAAEGEPSLSAWLAGRGDAGADADPTAPDPLIGLLATLRAVTARFACHLRTASVPPEQMLVRVKACVREAVVAERWHDPEEVQAVTAAVVGWSIAAYYDR